MDGALPHGSTQGPPVAVARYPAQRQPWPLDMASGYFGCWASWVTSGLARWRGSRGPGQNARSGVGLSTDAAMAAGLTCTKSTRRLIIRDLGRQQLARGGLSSGRLVSSVARSTSGSDVGAAIACSASASPASWIEDRPMVKAPVVVSWTTDSRRH